MIKDKLMRVAIYCRVSTDRQEQEGTSLTTQLEQCLKYCQDNGYRVLNQFSESFSGLTLERPMLNQLRELVSSRNIDVIVIYSTDRLSRDPTHGVILMQEFEKYDVKLEAVSETVESTELGKLISYIRGFASKLEAEKIRERTMRGKKAIAKAGMMQSGGYDRTFGYDYHKKSDGIPARRVINETEAEWVKKIFNWMAIGHKSTYYITNELNNAGVLTKRGHMKWQPCSVRAVLKNTSYIGITYAYKKTDKIELPGTTPAIVTPEVFEAAQQQLKANKKESKRNMKREYLLRGHIRCKECNMAYYGRTSGERRATRKSGNEREWLRRYCCSGKLSHVKKDCHNKSWLSDDLENRVWARIAFAIKHPETIFNEFEKRKRSADSLLILQDELATIEKKLKTLDKDQEQLLQLALKGFPENMVETQNKKINSERAELKERKANLEAKIEASKNNVIDVDRVNKFIAKVQDKIDKADFHRKRLALDMLDITVWIDGKQAYITGFIGDAIVINRSTLNNYNCTYLPFKIEV